jgi:hypothetical protein
MGSKIAPKIWVYAIVDNKTALKSIFQLSLELVPYRQYTAGHFFCIKLILL